MDRLMLAFGWPDHRESTDWGNLAYHCLLFYAKVSKITVHALCNGSRFQNDKMKVTFSSTFSSFLQVCYKAEIFQY